MGKASFDMDDDHDLPDMYYYDIPSEDTELSFEEYVRIAYIDYTYSRMDEKFGDWELKYDIKKATRITDEGDPDIEEANAYFHEIVYNYYEFASDLPVGSDEEETLEEFYDELSEIDISEAYIVDVKVDFVGTEGYYSDGDHYVETFQYAVARAGSDWFILDGTSIYDIIELMD